MWQGQGLTLRFQRLLWLEQKTAAAGGVLTEHQVRLLQRWQGKATDRNRTSRRRVPAICCVKTRNFVGTIKGVGRIYLQRVVDAHCLLAFGKLYLSKVPMTAVDVVHDRAWPFYEEHGVEVDHVLTDNGREYCGRPLHHPFELFLAISQVTHRQTEVSSPETNWFCERFHRTVKEEFFSVAFRKTVYESVAQLQADLDAYVTFYNRERVHQDYRTQGRTPYRALCDGLVVRPTQEATGSEAA